MFILPMTVESWQLAGQLLADGELVALPTDTVYGVACDPYNVAAIEKLYTAKGRDRLKALPLLLSDVDGISLAARAVPDSAKRLAAAFWPGALTLVVPRLASLPASLSGGDTIAVRVPDHTQLRAFIASCGGSVAASSANLSGQPDALTAQQVAAYLGEHVQLVIDGGATPGGIPSTVVDCTLEAPAILRSGAIGAEAIERVLGRVGTPHTPAGENPCTPTFGGEVPCTPVVE